MLDVSGSAAGVQADLAALDADVQVGRITVTDSAAITVSVAQLIADATALGDLANLDGSPVRLAVVDTAADVLPVRASLAADPQVGSVAVLDTSLDLSGAELDALQAAASRLAQIEVSDGDASTGGLFPLTLAQLSGDSAALAILGRSDGQPITFDIEGTGAGISAALSQPLALPARYQITDTDGAPVTIDAAAITSAAVAALRNAEGTPAPLAIVDTAGHVLAEVAALALSGKSLSDYGAIASVTVSDAASAIAANLDALQGAPGITAIQVLDDTPVQVSVAQLAADAAALAKLAFADGQATGVLNVQDTAADLSAQLDALAADGQVGRITVSDSAAVTLSVAQLVRDASALAELVNLDGTPVTFAVVDTAANLSNALDVLEADPAVVSMTVSDTNLVQVSIAQLASDAAILAKLVTAGGQPAPLDVTDTSAAIAADLDALNADPRIGRITLSDSQPVVVTAAQIADDGVAISELRNADGAPVVVTPPPTTFTGTAAQLSDAELDVLQAKAGLLSIVVTDNGASGGGFVDASVAQLTADAAALSELSFVNGQTLGTVQVTDTAAALSADLDALNADAQVGRLVVSDGGTVAVTVAQLLDDTTAVGELTTAGGAPVVLGVTDTAANIIPQIEYLNADPQVGAITVSDTAADLGGTELDLLQATSRINAVLISDTGKVAASVAQLTGDATALSKLAHADGQAAGPVDVTDTAVAIAADLDALAADGQVGAITVSDSQPVGVTVAQLATDAAALAELRNADGSPVAVTVSDTAANITADLDALQGDPRVGAIVVSDNGASSDGYFDVSVAQLTADASALAKLAFADGQTAGVLDVQDTAAAIAADLDALNADPQVGRTDITDSQPLDLTASQMADDTQVLAETAHLDGAPMEVMSGAQNVYAGTAADLSGVELDVLEADPTITGIVAADDGASNGGFVTASVAQLTLDAGALALLSFADGQTAAILNVQDTAADVVADLDALAADAQVGRITLSDNQALSVSVAQLTADAAGLAELVDLSGAPVRLAVSDTVAAVLADLSTLEATPGVASLTLTEVAVAELPSVTAALAGVTLPVTVQAVDTAEALSGPGLDALEATPDLGSVTVSDDGASTNGYVLATVAELSSDGGALSRLVFADGRVSGLMDVQDTAADIAANFDALNIDTQLGRIDVTDNAPVTLSASQLVADTAAIAELHDLDGSTPVIDIVDTAANLSGEALNAIQADPLVGSIVASDDGASEGGYVVASVAQLTSDAASLARLAFADGRTAGVLNVVDAAAAISADLDALTAYSQVGRITVADSAGVTLDVAQVASDATAIGELAHADGTAATLAVVDTAANILPALAGLEADPLVASITVNDSAADLTGALDALQATPSITALVVIDDAVLQLTAAQVTADAGALSRLAFANGQTAATVQVTDTAADIAADFDALNADVQVGTIAISDSQPVVLTAAQALEDPRALYDLVDANGTPVSVTVRDSAAELSGATLDALQALSPTPTLVVSDDAPLQVDAAQLTSDAGVLAKLAFANGQTTGLLDVADTGAELTADLAALAANTQVAEVTVTGGTLSLSPQAALADAVVVEAGASLALTGYDILGFDVTLDGGTLSATNAPSGVLTVPSGGAVRGYGMISTSSLDDEGTITASGGRLTIDTPVTGAGGFAIEAGATLELADAASPTVAFDGAGVLQLDAAPGFTGAITGLQVGDVIALNGVTPTGAPALSGDTLSVPTTAGPLSFTVQGADPTTLQTAVFQASQDSLGDTLLTLTSTLLDLTPGVDTLTAGAPDVALVAAANTLSTGDQVDGAGPDGDIPLELVGGGLFDLGAPASLTGVTTVDAVEGQGAYGSGDGAIAATRQTLYLRDGLDVTVDVAADPAPNPLNPNAPGITIYGAGDADVIDLGTGDDSVHLGGAAETVNGGGGDNRFYVDAATLAATIAGGSGDNILYVSGGGVETMGAAVTGISRVYLLGPGAGQTQPATRFTANATAGLQIHDDTGGGDTLTLGDPSQVVTLGLGDHTIEATAATAGAAIFNPQVTDSVVEVSGGGGFTVNPVDYGLTFKLDQPSTITLNDYGVAVQGSAGDDTIVAGQGALDGLSDIDGGGGDNTLELSGGGLFDLRAPAVLSDIATLTASEGQGEYRSADGTVDIANQEPIIFLRAGLDATLDLSSAASLNPANPHASGAIVYGADNDAAIHLGSGVDTVYVGGAGETVQAGGGNDIFYATADTIGATLDGGTGRTELVLTGGGTAVMGANITDIATVVLTGAASGATQPAWAFTANAEKGLEILDGGAGDTLTLGDASQTVLLEGGDHRVIADAATSAAAVLTSGGGDVVLEITGGGELSVNAADANLTVQLDAASTLTLNDNGVGVVGSAGDDTIIASTTALLPTTALDGGGGTNTLALAGGGVFDLRVPASITDISQITATEAQGEYRSADGSTFVAGAEPIIYLRDGLDATLTLASAATTNGANPHSAGAVVYGADNAATIDLGSGTDTVYLGGAVETVHGGGGNDLFYATASTIGATIDGGAGSSTLFLTGGGTATMGADITDLAKVVLTPAASGAAQPAWSFTANAEHGLEIDDDAEGDAVTVGDASQVVLLSSGDHHVIETAATAGAAVLAGASGTDVLEIAGGGEVVLNASDARLTVELDQASDLTLSSGAGMTAIGGAGADTITALAAGQTLTGGGGADTLVGSTSGGDTFKDTTADLDGVTVKGFGVAGDVLDVTDLDSGSASISFKEDAGAAFGTLTVADGAKSASLILFGQFMAAGFSTAADAGSGTAITYTPPPVQNALAMPGR